MPTPSATQVFASAPATALPGTWKLVRGRAVTLRPADDGILRIAHGRVWATLDGPHGATPDDAGDHILQDGRSMLVRAGQRVVLEAWNASGASWFTWDPIAVPAPALLPRLNFAGVLQPLADLRVAGVLAVRAIGQLASGLVQLGWALLHGGGRSVPGRRPHGAIG